VADSRQDMPELDSNVPHTARIRKNLLGGEDDVAARKP
jgi:hypothetical protein